VQHLQRWLVEQASRLNARRAGGVSRRRSLPRLAAVVGLVAVAATGCSWNDMPRFGWPSPITPQGERMLHLWIAFWIAAFAVGALVWGLTFWCVIMYRKKNDELPRQVKYSLPIEFVCVGLPLCAIAILFYFTAVTENYVTKVSKNPDVQVTVTGFKWNWEFSYQGTKEADGVNDVNTIGTSTEIPILVLPVNETIKIDEVSPDVIHSFWVPKLLFKRDVIPGLTNTFQITITKEGSYVGHCAELCGTYHSQMNFELRSVSQSEYQAYLAKLATFKPGDANYANRQSIALASIGQPPYAVTTHPFNTERDVRHAS